MDFLKKSRKKRIFISAAAIIAALSFLAISLLPNFITPARAASTKAQLEEKLRESQKKKEKAKQEQAEISSKKEIAQSEANKLDKEIDAIEDEIAGVNLSIAESNEAIYQKESEISEQHQKIENYTDKFVSRARVMYKRGPTTYIDVLFGAEDFADLLYKVQMIKKITEYDQKIIKEMTDAKNAIIAAKEAIEDEKSRQELSRQILQNNQSELESKLAQKQSAIEKLNSDAEKAKALEDEADAEMAQFRNELAGMSSSGQASSSSTSTSVASYGSMQWPAVASKTITSPYGYRFHPIQKVNRFHSGIDIGAPYGTGIVAAESGKVIKAAWNGGYGKCIVLDHGGGIYTLYGHCSQLNVSVGQSVSRGQTIGLIGSTGNSTGPHLHFEVLINGSTTNPLSYVG